MGTPQARIFSIERHALHDGPGIRTLVFFQGCPLRCRWCSNPEGLQARPQLLYNEQVCSSCGRCLPVCPAGAISRKEGRAPAAGQGRPANDRAKCTGCGTCVGVCPAGARRICGALMSVEEILPIILRDEVFYRHSGGGVTLSGGEPLVQADFAAQLLARCRSSGIHTAVETCGAVPWSSLEQVVPVTDLFLYDLKHLDAGKHRQSTGAGNGEILENLTRLSRRGASIIVRVPVVPGFNDTPGELKRIVEFARSLQIIREIHLLPYHRLGLVKYRQMERRWELEDLETPDAGRLHGILQEAESNAAPDIQVRMEV